MVKVSNYNNLFEKFIVNHKIQLKIRVDKVLYDRYTCSLLRVATILPLRLILQYI